MNLLDLISLFVLFLAVGINIGFWTANKKHKAVHQYNDELIKEYRKALKMSEDVLNEYRGQGRIRVVQVKLSPTIDTNLQNRMN